MIDVPIAGLRLGRGQNDREHHHARGRRVAHEKNVVTLVLRGTVARTMMVFAPLSVTITRIAPSKGLNDDNAVSSAKAVRDAVAGVLGIDDRDERVDWLVRQERGPWGVRIRIETRS
jgi:hypothetical protein